MSKLNSDMKGVMSFKSQDVKPTKVGGSEQLTLSPRESTDGHVELLLSQQSPNIETGAYDEQ